MAQEPASSGAPSGPRRGLLLELPLALLAPSPCAWGFFVAKSAAALLLVLGGAGPLVMLAFAAGFLGDAAVLLPLLALGAVLAGAQKDGGPSRGARLLLLLLGAGLGLYAVANVYLVAGYGSPLTSAMLSYRKDADPSALWAPGPLLALGLALLVFLLGLVPFLRLVRRLRPRTFAGGVVLLAIVGGVATVLDEDGSLRALGLDRSAVSLFITSSLPPSAGEPSRIPWDAPWPAPADPALSAAPPVDASRGRPRHVVVWLAESVAFRHTVLGGAPAEATPRLAELRRHGLSFESYYASSPVSAKAIFGTLCGLYPLPEADFEARRNPRIACPSLMETLTAAGFDAALFHGGYFAFTDKLAFLEERGLSVLMDGESVPDRERFFTNGWGIDDAALVEHGLAWLDARPERERPSLAIYIPLLPHYEYFLPKEAPRPFGERTLFDRYRNGLHYTDLLFGRLVDEYERRGLLDDTLFVFVGDHGEAFEEHPRNKLHAGFLYEENVRTPLLIVSPRLFAEPMVSRRLGSHVDLAPTIFSLLGVPQPAGLQGRSLVDEAPYRPVLLGTWYPDPLLGLRDGDRKLVLHLRTGMTELYDLARDPGEKRNIAPAFPEVVRAYEARLRDWQERQRRFILEHPTKGEGFLDRTFGGLEAALIEPASSGGAAAAPVACERRADGARIVCPGSDVWLGIERERVFNMERRCLRVHPPRTGRLVLRMTTSTPVRTVGIGLTDRARRARGAPLRARFEVEGHEAIELEVSDRFERSSRVRTLGPSTEGSATVEVEIWSEKAGNRGACLTLSP
jgi:arylsulfatase A-like enzyme